MLAAISTPGAGGGTPFAPHHPSEAPQGSAAGPEWVGSQSWEHSELAGSSEVQWPALPAKPGPLRGRQRIYSSVEGPAPAHLLPWRPLRAMPEEGTLTTEFLSGSQSGFVGGNASGI